MVLLDVLDESWVIKLCRVIAVGRQIAVRPEKVCGIQIALQAKICEFFSTILVTAYMVNSKLKACRV